MQSFHLNKFSFLLFVRNGYVHDAVKLYWLTKVTAEGGGDCTGWRNSEVKTASAYSSTTS